MASTLPADAAPSAPPTAAPSPAPAPNDDSPEARMARRFPQKIRTGDLVGLPVIDDDNRVFATIVAVVRTPAGKVRLVVRHGGFLGRFGRLVAVPIEVVAIVGRQVASMDLKPEAYRTLPTWVEGDDRPIGDDEIIRIALTRR